MMLLRRLWGGAALVVALAAPFASSAGQIVLDRSVTAGRYWLFPLAEDPHSYLYVVAQAQLARHPSGKPQFSFLRFVENAVSAGGTSSLTDASGGGLVHAVVELGVPDSEREQALAEAQRLLANIDPAGKIVGPASYSAGQFMLVSSFQQDGEEKLEKEKRWVEKVVAIGEAPILEGGKAAVSARLTREGAQVLWESFHSATPDITFVFKMQLDGVNSPVDASVKVDWERMYSNERLRAGLATPLTQTDIDVAFEDLRQQGAIRFTQVGDGDADFNAMVKKTFEDIRDLMFDKSNGLIAQNAKTGDGAAGAKGQDTQSVAQRAEALRNTRKTDWESRASQYKSQVTAQEAKARQARAKADEAAARARDLRAKWVAAREKAESEEKAQAKAETEKKAAADGTKTRDVAKQVPDAAALKRQQDAAAAKKKQEEAAAARKKQQEEAAKSKQQEEAKKAADAKRQQEVEASVPRLEAEVEAADQEAQRLAQIADQEEQALVALKGKEQKFNESVDDLVLGGFGAIFTYTLKRERQSLDMDVDFRKYRSATRNLPFEENIGDLRRYLQDDAVFRSVNLADPMYKQREIAVSVDNSNAEDFKKYINYVSVQLRKEHEGGEPTIGEVRIDRENFSTRANDFRLLYGWKGDDDRAAWLRYQYRALWSFNGGNVVEQAWTESTEGTIPLLSPYQRRSVELDGDPTDLESAGVRAVVFTLYYELAGVERSERVTLKTSKGELSQKVDFMLPVGDYRYEYEILWMLAGNKTVSSGRQQSDSPLLFINDIPETNTM